jgi:hypothetical protein
VLALAKDKWRQEEAATQQHREKADWVTVLESRLTTLTQQSGTFW